MPRSAFGAIDGLVVSFIRSASLKMMPNPQLDSCRDSQSTSHPVTHVTSDPVRAESNVAAHMHYEGQLFRATVKPIGRHTEACRRFIDGQELLAFATASGLL